MTQISGCCVTNRCVVACEVNAITVMADPQVTSASTEERLSSGGCVRPLLFLKITRCVVTAEPRSTVTAKQSLRSTEAEWTGYIMP